MLLQHNDDFFLGETIGTLSDFGHVRNQLGVHVFYVNHFLQNLIFILELYFFKNLPFIVLRNLFV